MASLDIFKGSAFSVTSMTNMILARPYVPGLLGRMGLFTETPVRTTSIFVDRMAGRLALIPDTPRTAPSNQITRDPRNTRNFVIPHKPLQDVITADEIQDIRDYEGESELLQVQTEVGMRMDKLNVSHDATLELQRMYALRGFGADVDGTVRYNFYNQFGVTQITVDFDLGNANADILGKCLAVRDAMQTNLGSDGGDDIRVMALVGATFFNRFVAHPKVATAYAYYQRNAPNDPLTQDLRYIGFTFGGITFRAYRGNVNGTAYMPASEGVAFPNEANIKLFETVFAPANFLDTANTLGRPKYAQIVRDPFNKYATLDTQSNPFSFARRPEANIKLTTGS
jgi:hypothetical protein